MESNESSSSSSEDDMFLYIDIIGRQRVFRNRSDPFHVFDDAEFHTRFRLSKQTVMHILELIGHDIAPLTQRNRSVSAFQNVIGDNMGLHKSTICRIVKKVLHSVAALAVNEIKMPASPEEIAHVEQQFMGVAALAVNEIKMPASPEEIAHVEQQFMGMYGFPHVIGCIDGMHITIQSPGGDNAEVYRNRKGYFSYNVQVVCDCHLKIRRCDCHLKIRRIDAHWPGSTHDSSMFNASNLRLQMENEYHHCILLGDSAYPCKTYLMTPILHPANDAETRYNNAQTKTRNCVERCFGIWNCRFPALSVGLRISKETALKAIVAAAVLHNLAADEGLEVPEPEVELLANEVPQLSC
ncbi:DDE superfamily endonuclease [Popillia japonica]|uniref:DDE superfamily endonuclease n=1 Tax=Popillia japonica TaxID=7064 RepID=A0AAW1KHH0_POPJA